MDFLWVWFWICIVLMDPFPIKTKSTSTSFLYLRCKGGIFQCRVVIGIYEEPLVLVFLSLSELLVPVFHQKKRGLKLFQKPQIFSNFKTLNPKNQKFGLVKPLAVS